MRRLAPNRKHIDCTFLYDAKVSGGYCVHLKQCLDPLTSVLAIVPLEANWDDTQCTL